MINGRALVIPRWAFLAAALVASLIGVGWRAGHMAAQHLAEHRTNTAILTQIEHRLCLIEQQLSIQDVACLVRLPVD